MEEIADEERRAEDVKHKKQRSSQSSVFESETTVEEEFDDYDNFVSKLLLILLHFKLFY